MISPEKNFYPESREWNLGGERFIGWDFKTFVYYTISASRIHPSFYRPPRKKAYPEIVTACTFNTFLPKPHERTGEARMTGIGKPMFWTRVRINPVAGGNWSVDPQFSEEVTQGGYALGFFSKVRLGLLGRPNEQVGTGHFVMADLALPPTRRNIQHIITEVRKRTKLTKFFIIRSSRDGTMLFAPEIVDEPHLLAIWNDLELANHVEISRGRRRIDFVFDSRWHARSQQNHKDRLGIPNRSQNGGILRLSASFPIKPETPMVIAASFD